MVIQGLAEHKDQLGAPLCPCRHYDDKEAEAQMGYWNCPCVPMRERKVGAPMAAAAAGAVARTQTLSQTLLRDCLLQLLLISSGTSQLCMHAPVCCMHSLPRANLQQQHRQLTTTWQLGMHCAVHAYFFLALASRNV